MTRPLTVIKSVGPKLVPFFKTCAIFFVLFPNDDTSYPQWLLCISKVAPILSLIGFVLLHGISLTSEQYSYSRRILLGLVASTVGDLLLVFHQQFFIHGVAAFGIAQGLYASAFGLYPFNLPAGVAVAAVGASFFAYVTSAMQGVLVVAIGAYVTLISLMVWRAIARVQFFDDLWTWTKLCSCGGALVFAISDGTIALDKFCFRVPFAHAIIMSTYYCAQLLIALSVVDSQTDKVIAISHQLNVQKQREVKKKDLDAKSTLLAH